jgi:DNA ligase-1
MILLAKRWNGHTDPKGYWVSEKLDGHRSVWDGEKFISRGGNVIKAPRWFTEDFPKERIDGELWAGRGNIHKVGSLHGSREGDWHHVIYAVFDVPDHPGMFEDRLQHAKRILDHTPHGIVIPFWKCQSKGHLLQKLEEVVKGGGEGLMLRKPKSKYEAKRSDTLLKVKKKFDEEAVVIEHVEGTRPGLCGSLKVMTKDGRIFKVGSGITESMAHNPPHIGAIITFEYELVTKDNIPRSASFIRVRKDL